MNSNNKVHDLIEKRWSPRAFSDQQVEEEKLLRALEAARRAPSCSNEQPWRFIIGIKGEESWNKIFNVLDDFNVLWAGSAPVLGLVVAQKHFAKSGDLNRHYFYDCGQAMAYLTLQATSEGLFIHQMAGFSPEKAVESFKIPSGYEPVSIFAMGYLGDPQILPERMQKNEHYKVIRKELSEIAFSEWGKPLFS